MSELLEFMNITYASGAGDLIAVREFVESGVKPSSMDLAYAAKSGNIELVTYLQTHIHKKPGAVLNTAIIGTSENDQVIDYLIDQGYPITKNTIVSAAEMNRFDLLERFLVLGHRHDGSAYIGAVAGGHADLVDRLIEAGYVPNECAHEIAASNGDAVMVRKLLDLGFPMSSELSKQLTAKGLLNELKTAIARGCPIDPHECIKYAQELAHVHDNVAAIAHVRTLAGLI